MLGERTFLGGTRKVHCVPSIGRNRHLLSPYFPVKYGEKGGIPMSVFDDPSGKLRWLEEELLEEEADEEEEEEYEDSPRQNHARNFRRTVYLDEEPMDDREAVFIKKKRKGTGGLKFLAFLEILGILAVIWWWIKWLY